jgi:hypothetical protein
MAGETPVADRRTASRDTRRSPRTGQRNDENGAHRPPPDETPSTRRSFKLRHCRRVAVHHLDEVDEALVRLAVDRVPVDRVPGDRALVDRALVDRALVDRALVDRALVDRALVDRVTSLRRLTARVLRLSVLRMASTRSALFIRHLPEIPIFPATSMRCSLLALASTPPRAVAGRVLRRRPV